MILQATPPPLQATSNEHYQPAVSSESKRLCGSKRLVAICFTELQDKLRNLHGGFACMCAQLRVPCAMSDLEAQVPCLLQPALGHDAGSASCGGSALNLPMLHLEHNMLLAASQDSFIKIHGVMELVHF